MGRVSLDNVKEVCTYHPPSREQWAAFERIEYEAVAFITTILEVCPESADRSDAIRKVREARMAADVSIALKGII